MGVKNLGLVVFLSIASFVICNPLIQAASSSANVVYGVSLSSAGEEAKLSPIVIYQNGRFEKPYDAFDEDVSQDARFEENFLKAETPLTLLYNNRSLGTMALLGRPANDVSPTPITALRAHTDSERDILSFKTKSKSNVSQQFWLLSSSNPPPESFKAQPTEEDPEAIGLSLEPIRPTNWDISMLQFLARKIYAKKGLSDYNLSKIVTVDVKKRFLTVKDKKPSLFGTFTLTTFPLDKDQSRVQRVLFLMATPSAKGYRLALSDYKIDPSRVPYLIDTLDLTGDGVSEVIVEYPKNQETEFGIYERKKGQWQRVYTGGGTGNSFIISQ